MKQKTTTLEESFLYKHETGKIYWKISRRRIKLGSIAGSLRPDGYVAVCLNGKSYLAHRTAWFLYYGQWPKNHLDHVNGLKADNRICNLREATEQQNQANSKTRKTNSSGIKGVCFDKVHKCWKAQIQCNGKRFDKQSKSKDILLEWIIEMRTKLHKEFARHA